MKAIDPRTAALIGAIAAVAGAQGVRVLAKAEYDDKRLDEPYAPSPESASMMSLGYREMAADLLFFRLVGYFGDSKATAPGVAGLVEAIVALDPEYRKIYLWGGHAILAARRERSNELSMRAIRILEAGANRYPDEYKLPELAGEAYLFDLAVKPVDEKKDPNGAALAKAQRREWDEKAAHWLEIAVRKPNAPAGSATMAAQLRTKLGQKQRAIDSLRELILITDDQSAREKLFDKLAELEHSDASDVAAELIGARKQFETAWRHDRPEMRPSLYVIVGPTPQPGFALADLATGGRDLVDVSATSGAGPSSP
jgi:hypothetical protein